MIFLSYLLGLSSVGLAFYHQNVLFSLPFILIVLYHLYRKRNVTTTLFMVITMVYLGHLYWQSTPSVQAPHMVFITERRPTYMIASSGIKRYYIKILETDSFEFADIIQANFKSKPLSITTYESTFNFKSYLHTKGVYEELVTKDYKFVFHSPLRIKEKQTRFLSFFPENNRPWVSQLLFHQSEGLDTHGYYLVYVSGFGFYVMQHIVKKLLHKLSMKSHLLPFGILFPYVLMHLNRFSILRVYLFSLFDHSPLMKEDKKSLKLGVLIVIGLGLPHLSLQSGFQIYLLFQLYFSTFQSILTKRPFYLRPMLTMVMVSLIQLIYFQSLTPFSLFFYLPVSFFNALLGLILFIPFLIELYTPMLSVIMTIYQEVIQGILSVSFRLYLPSIQMLATFVLTLLILSMILFYLYRYQKGLKTIFLTFLFLASYHLTGWNQFWESPSIHFINVGQGDSTLIRHRKTNVLIDTGGQLSFDVATDVLIPYFRKLNIRFLNAVILTHGDFDHDGALPSLQKHFNIHDIIRDPFTNKTIGDIHLSQWNKQFMSEDENENSLVISTVVGTCSILIMGDASVHIEESILNDLPLSHYDILRTGHHGSLTSTSDFFLDRVKPKTAIISVAESNRYGHPHPTVIQRLVERNISIRRTDKDGTIVYKSCKL